MSSPRILFMGTPEIARASLEALIQEKFNIIEVVTQPDRPQGRNHQLIDSPIKKLAKENNIPLFKPEKIKKNEITHIQSLNPDLIVVVAYGCILPETLLSIPKYGCINVHPSLLPKYRGPAPINWAIINGETTTGITIQKIVKEIDAGNILYQEKVEILDSDDGVTLLNKITPLAAQLLCHTIKKIITNKITETIQDKNQVTVAPLLKKEDGKINWNESALQIHNRIRGLLPWPVAFTKLNGITTKLFSSKLDLSDTEATSGTIVNLTKESIVVKCGKGSIHLLELQQENRKKLNAAEFARGLRLEKGMVFE